jgi:hypothetical protein
MSAQDQRGRAVGTIRGVVWAAAGLIIVLIVVYLLAVPFGLVDTDDRLGSPEIVLASVVVVMLLFAAQRTYAVTSLAFGGARAEFQRIDARQEGIEAEVRALQVAVSGIVDKFELVHLEKLSADRPATVRFGEIMQSQLTHLDAINFVRPTRPRGLNAIRDDHGSGVDDFDLKDYLAITPEGRDYLALRGRLTARSLTAAAVATQQ